MPLGDELLKHQAEAGASDGRKNGQQHRQRATGCHLAAEAQHLPFGIASSPAPATLLKPLRERLQHLERWFRRAHVNNGGSVFAGRLDARYGAPDPSTRWNNPTIREWRIERTMVSNGRVRVMGTRQSIERQQTTR